MVTSNYVVSPDEGCWLWRGHMYNGTTPVMKHDGRVQPVRRVLWQEKNGPIPRGERIKLVCEHTRCVNPDHCKPFKGKRQPPRKTHAQRREEHHEIYMLRGCEKTSVIAAMYGLSVNHVSRIHTLGRTHQL